jgi:spore coat polysaccharide biosynthesis protein SpsF
VIQGVLQARTSSSRLPGKILMPILGIPMLEHQVRRLLRCCRMDSLLLATSDETSDDPVADLAASIGIGCFRGSLDDVLDRFYRAAAASHPDHVVRFTGDCPLADPEIVDRAIALHLETKADYTTNALEPTWPDGLDVEVVRFASLEQAWKEARKPSEREHVTPFINTQPRRYAMRHLKDAPDLSGLRWTVDEPEDFEFVRRVYERLYPGDPRFGTREILSLLEREPELGDLNRRFIRNEGLKKSLAKDALAAGKGLRRSDGKEANG